MFTPSTKLKLMIYLMSIFAILAMFRLAQTHLDPTAGLLSAISMFFAVVARQMAITERQEAKCKKEAMRRLIDISKHACDVFEIYPGTPEGYAGYTDYNIMNAIINNDLLERSYIEQYALLGFGNGFLKGIESRLAEAEHRQRTAFHIPNASDDVRKSIGWLSFLQKYGIDNASPSTKNLSWVVHSVAKSVCETGPITMAYWKKILDKKQESLDLSGVSLDWLQQLVDEYQQKFDEGGLIATMANQIDFS